MCCGSDDGPVKVCVCVVAVMMVLSRCVCVCVVAVLTVLEIKQDQLIPKVSFF